MLVIGDLNSLNISDGYNIYNREYICENSNEINDLVNKFKLQKKYLVSSNNMSVTYNKKNKLYTFHDSSNYLILNALYRLASGNIYKSKYASGIIEWAICKSRVKFIHTNVYSWCNRVETYLELNSTLSKYDEQTKKMFQSYSYGLSSWIINTYGIDKSIYKSNNYIIYDKKELFDVISNSSESIYLKILLNKNDLSKSECVMESMFNRLDYNDKIKAFIEKVYVEMLCEYIIPEVEISGNLPKGDYFELYLKSFMNICSSYTNYTFANFGIHNYYTIVDKFNEDIIKVVFYDAIKNKTLSEKL